MPVYTPAELMVVAAAREIRDYDVAFVGMRLPLLSFQLANATHAPHATSIFELGAVRDTPVSEMIYTMGDLPVAYGAQWLTDLLDAMSLLQQGLVDVSFIGGAEIDRFGNLNTTYIGESAHPTVRLPGSGGGCDLACLAQRVLVIMAHEPRRFVGKVSYVTSPGYGDVITTLGVLRFEAQSREMYLHSVHPGVTVAEVKAATGWDLRVADSLHETPPPTDEELRLLRQFDPQGFWTRA
jgi:glutaconate CoA-transferase subunit B